MAGKRKKDEPLSAYRRVRKRVPPPGRILPDRRRRLAEKQAKREQEEGLEEP